MFYSKKNTDSSQKVYLTLRNRILDLTIKPGEEILERNICKEFGVSRTPVREAFLRLNSNGLLKTIPYQSSFASLLSLQHIKQYIYMRIAVESMVLSDFIENANQFHIEELRYFLNLQHVLLKSDFTPHEFYNYDSSFHRVWFKHTNKIVLWKIIQRAHVQYKRFRMLDIVAVQNFSQIVQEHDEIFNAMIEKKSEIIQHLIKKHLNGGIARLGNKIWTDFAHYFEPEEINHSVS